eukprot:g4144.t1
MLGLDAAGKTTILYRLHIGEVLSTAPTIGFNVETIRYKNVMFTVWDISGPEKMKSPLQHYFCNTDALIFVVDSCDIERLEQTAVEFKSIIEDPLMKNIAILVFANKQDVKGCLTTDEICKALGLPTLKARHWNCQSSVAIKGEGLYEGLDWLSSTLKETRQK